MLCKFYCKALCYRYIGNLVHIKFFVETNCVLVWIKGYLRVLCSYVGALFADACLKGLNGVPDVVESSYVQSNITELPFFASRVLWFFVCDFPVIEHVHLIYYFYSSLNKKSQYSAFALDVVTLSV